MSSTLSQLLHSRLPFAALLLAATAADAQNPVKFPPLKEIVQPIPPGASTAAPQGTGATLTAQPPQDEWNAARADLMRVLNPAIMSTLTQWRSLQQSDTLGFSAYASFLLDHPDWPGSDRMRRLAETSITPNAMAPVLVTQFFGKYPPRTATGFARYAIALSSLGRMAEARSQARSAWRGGTLSPSDEAQILNLFGSAISSDDHSARADALLWQRNPTAAERILAYTPAQIRSVFEARIAMQRAASDAVMKMQTAEPYAVGDPGFLTDKVAWLRDNGNAIASRSLLAERHSLARRPFNPEKWFETLLAAARGAASDGQFQLAYAIASKVDDAYDPEVQVRDQPYGERDEYTNLTWLAGTTAYYQIDRARDAVRMFERYAAAARSPQTIAKGYYWAGRAALMASDKGLADRYFAAAAAYPDQFHGQLALERLGRPIPSPVSYKLILTTLTEEEQQAFANRSVVRAAKALGASGLWKEQTLFLRTIAAAVSDEKERALAFDLAKTLARPDLGVMVGRRALSNGDSGYADASFPSQPIPYGHETNWTMIHAIARQESQFDRAAVSHAGARGLMQLMPGTAKETAGKIGLAYMLDSLTSDTQYNIQLGSSYFQRMLRYYGGSYPLAVAAYNAGPGNVNRWITANGDPRLPGVDMVRWIENIPISETRNYVQRVLENAVVYDAIRPETAQTRGSTRPLSRYLGKNDAG